MKYILATTLFFLSAQLHADQAVFHGENAVVPDPVQQELIATSIHALLEDCSVAIKVDKSEIKLHNRRLEVTFTQPVNFDTPPAGKINGVNRVIVSLWDNAEETMRMNIYAYTNKEIYSFSKYAHLAYPVINMIRQPMPPGK